ncbi:putative restriction endonuclease domain-containing protein [Gammaproteobacteria bacterium]
MSAQPKPYFTPQAYLTWERQQDTRHEFVNGEIYAMTGASRPHNIVNGNTFAALHAQMRGRPCEVYSNDMRVKVSETGMYTYPDIVAACGEPLFEDAEVDTLLNPVLIIEILSESTERYDRGAKFLHYRTLPSLQDYVLVAQSECRVEHYARQAGNRWLLMEYQDLGETLSLTSVSCDLPLSGIYERTPVAGSLNLSTDPT